MLRLEPLRRIKNDMARLLSKYSFEKSGSDRAKSYPAKSISKMRGVTEMEVLRGSSIE